MRSKPATSPDNSVNFISFLEDLDQKIDADLEVRVVLDNGSSHASKATTAWFAEHPRFVTNYTPKHAGWLNQIPPMAAGSTSAFRDPCLSRGAGCIASHRTAAEDQRTPRRMPRPPVKPKPVSRRPSSVPDATRSSKALDTVLLTVHRVIVS